MENRLDGFDRSKSGSLKKSRQIYISWEMTPTSIGGEKQAGISGGSQSPS